MTRIYAVEDFFLNDPLTRRKDHEDQSKGYSQAGKEIGEFFLLCFRLIYDRSAQIEIALSSVTFDLIDFALFVFAYFLFDFQARKFNVVSSSLAVVMLVGNFH